jgi:hypothetical protein
VYGHTKHCNRNHFHQINKIIEQLISPSFCLRLPYRQVPGVCSKLRMGDHGGGRPEQSFRSVGTCVSKGQ